MLLVPTSVARKENLLIWSLTYLSSLRYWHLRRPFDFRVHHICTYTSTLSSWLSSVVVTAKNCESGIRCAGTVTNLTSYLQSVAGRILFMSRFRVNYFSLVYGLSVLLQWSWTTPKSSVLRNSPLQPHLLCCLERTGGFYKRDRCMPTVTVCLYTW